MGNLDFPYWIILAVVPIMVLSGLALNYKRARKWEEKIRRHGQVHCRNCGYVGELAVRALSSGLASSSNLRLVCGKCDSPNWFVPDSEKAS